MFEEPPPLRSTRDALFLKLGGWLEARATGRGVIVLGAIVLSLVVAGLARLLLA